jgi:hypothetical protein
MNIIRISDILIRKWSRQKLLFFFQADLFRQTILNLNHLTGIPAYAEPTVYWAETKLSSFASEECRV